VLRIADLRKRARELKTEVLALLLAARHPRTPWYAKLFLVAIVAYALSPIDLIPDFIPVLGFVDDIILLPFAIALAVQMVPADVLAECRARALARRPDGSWAGRLGAAMVILLWLALIALAVIWAHDSFARERGRERDDGVCAVAAHKVLAQYPVAPRAVAHAQCVGAVRKLSR